MEEEKNLNIKKLLHFGKSLIDKRIFLFLIQLVSKIFLKDRPTTRNDELKKKAQKFLIKINDDIINGKKNKDKIIDFEYDEKNLRNIFNFIKMQNSKFASEIFENILIIVFSFGFFAEKQKSFAKYLYNSLRNIKTPKEQKNEKDPKRLEISQWFNKDKFKFLDNSFLTLDKNVSPFTELLESDFTYPKTDKTKIQKSPIFELLEMIYYKNNDDFITKNKLSYYLDTDIEKIGIRKEIEEKVLNKDKKKDDSTLASISTSARITLNSNYLYTNSFNRIEKSFPIGIIRSLFISIYIYFQNKNSPLMKFTEKDNENEEFEIIPFEYNLSEAVIDDEYARIVLCPLRIEPRVSKIKYMKNIIKEKGFKELSKVLIFNNNISNIDYSFATIKSSAINYFNWILGLFDNNSVEKIDLSYNYLNEDSGYLLANILSHLKNLKAINLSSNELKRGISQFLITLKNLYREGKTKLETLNLIQCELDDIAFYELAELLKCKYCKLKKLYLSMNNIPYNVKFLKKLKKNRSLTQIYFSRSNLGNNDTDGIIRIISNTNVEYLYLYKNQIKNMDDIIKIIYRTKLIKKNEDINGSESNRIESNISESNISESNKSELYRSESSFYNLDLSFNECINKNKNKITLIKDIIDNTTLYSLDISGIFYGKNLGNTNEIEKNKKNLQADYTGEIDSLVKKLQEDYKQLNQLKDDSNTLLININEIDKNEGKKLFENEKLVNESDISKIIKDENAKFPLFIKEKSKELMKHKENKIKEISKKYKMEKKSIFKNLTNYLSLKRDENYLENKKKLLNVKKMIII